MEKIFIGVAWPYVSGFRHLGHVAGFGVPCDIFARYHRLKGNKVLMVSGSDMHGTPIFFRVEPVCVLSVLRSWWEHCGRPQGDDDLVVRERVAGIR